MVKNPRLEDPQQGSHATEKQQLPEHSLEGSSPDGNFVQVNLIAVLSMLVSLRDCDKCSLHHVSNTLRRSLQCTQYPRQFLSYLFVKKYLLVGMSGVCYERVNG